MKKFLKFYLEWRKKQSCIEKTNRESVKLYNTGEFKQMQSSTNSIEYSPTLGMRGSKQINRVLCF